MVLRTISFSEQLTMIKFRSLIFCLLGFASLGTSTLAHSPVGFFEVLAVDPARPIEHKVDLQSTFDEAKTATDLKGPQFFARSVGCLERPPKEKAAYLNWFQITDVAVDAVRHVSTLDMVRGSSSEPLKIQGAEFLLCPAQLITTGIPDPIPFGLDHYKAYRVVDAPSVDLKVVLTGSVGSADRKLLRPIFVCLPTSEQHHDEEFSVTHPKDCFVVYELDKLAHQQTFSTLDQFGLNELKSTEIRWICVRAAFLRSIAD